MTVNLRNPFIPSEIVTNPNDFFGRDVELEELETTLSKSSVAIQGAMGIGKTSLAYQLRQRMEGFKSDHKSKSILVVLNEDLVTLDDLARQIIERMIEINQISKKFTWKLPLINVVERESTEIIDNFVIGRHLATLVKLLEKDYIENLLDSGQKFIIFIDEADKNPELLARFVRTLLTQTQGNGVMSLRFVISGVRPFYTQFVAADKGMLRFFPNCLELYGLTDAGTEQLLRTNFSQVLTEAEQKGINVNMHPGVISRIIKMTAGHPHLIQLLGSHVIESENREPDGIIDSRDLITALRKVCIKDRNSYYVQRILLLETSGMVDSFASIFRYMSRKFPTRIDRKEASGIVDGSDIRWLTDNHFIYPHKESYYLEDELFKVKIILDWDQRFFNQDELESHYTLMSDLESEIDESEEYMSVRSDEYDDDDDL